ncbi:hypothetical protein [Streptomyces buecherae]|uniref:Uncharacterized protein n=1 Tax=Streptomyces buecherae TaxID=2763006 RepID=A0A7H8NB58_9ACTN|nr:hypothetical protein [Streptomyces buecherae]QKW51632.1 hypothetical protein HUT08_21285 [Streptomyces buecherae]
MSGAVFVTLNVGDAEEIERRVDAWSDTGEMTWSRFVDSFNSFEVRYLFNNWPANSDMLGDAELCLAELLIAPWSAKLSADFPDRRFSVELDEDPEADGPRILVRQTYPHTVR